MPLDRADLGVVLIVAADAALRGEIARMLRLAGYRIELAGGEKRAREIVERGSIDIAVLAPAQLGSTGPALVRELCDRLGRVVIIDEAGETTTDRVTAIPATAVYLAQPVSPKDLLAGVEQTQGPPVDSAPPRSDVLCFEGCTLDIDGRTFIDDGGRAVALTYTEFALLLDLARNPGRVRSREQLRLAAAGEALEVYERSIDMHISRLRRKIGGQARLAHLIATVPLAGYKFTARVWRDLAPAFAEPEQPQSAPASRAPTERRELTVLDCGIDGLTELANRRDTDEVLEVLASLHRAGGDLIRQYGGLLVHFLGDGLIAYFGYPEAHEDDVERAIRAGLALAETVSQMPDGRFGRLHVRVGISTGPAVVGDVGTAGTREYTALGTAPRLAARLKAAAAPDWVTVDRVTRRRAGRIFTYREIDSMESEASAPQVPAWRVVEAGTHVGRFTAHHKADLIPLAGRVEELAILNTRWRQACRGTGGAVLLCGEPGIGKSRLIYELEQSIRAEQHVRIQLFGSPYNINSPLFPIARHLERAGGIAPGDTSGDRLSKLHMLIDGTGPGISDGFALLASLLSLAHDRQQWVEELSSQRRKEKTFEVLRWMLARITATQPILMVFEDVQWFDPASVEMMASEVERVRQSPVLMLITARSEFAPPWPDYAHVTRLSMTQLDRGDAVALVKHAARAHPLSAATIEKIVNRADGVPLFLEELTREELSHGGQIPDPLSARDVPATLQGFMLARIDGLDQSDKAAAQAAAVIGRTFSHELLRMLEPCDPAELDASLDRLVAANLVFRHGTRPAATYLFKHALVQDAAYGTLPERKRRELHAGLAKILEERFAEVVATQPELLAHHHAGARNLARAVDYLITAAERALSRSAAVEAHAHCVSALELLSTLPQDQDRDRRELNVQIVLSRVWIATKGHTAPEFFHALDRARALAEALDDQKTVALVIYGLWNVAWGKANYAEAGTHAQALLAWGQRCNDRESMAFGHFILGTGLMPAGELSDAARHFKEALQGARIELPGGHLMTWGGAIGRVAALASLHNCLFLSGQLRRAEKALHDAIAEAQNVSQLYARAIALNLICRAHALRRDAESIQAPSAEMVQITKDQGYPQFGATALVFRGWGLAMGGDPGGGLDLAIAGLDRCRALGFRCWLTHHLALLAECHWRAGDINEARRTIVEAVAEIDHTGERVCEAELYRLDGELCRAAGGGIRGADYLFAKAMDIARERGARLLELRAATSLAHLCASEGRRAEALDALAPLYASFADARDIGEVYDAKVALKGLS